MGKNVYKRKKWKKKYFVKNLIAALHYRSFYTLHREISGHHFPVTFFCLSPAASSPAEQQDIIGSIVDHWAHEHTHAHTHEHTRTHTHSANTDESSGIEADSSLIAFPCYFKKESGRKKNSLMASGWKAAAAAKSRLKYLSSGNSGQRLPQKSSTAGGTPCAIKCVAALKPPILQPSPGSPPRLLPLSISVHPLAKARMCSATVSLLKKQ